MGPPGVLLPSGLWGYPVCMPLPPTNHQSDKTDFPLASWGVYLLVYKEQLL